MPVEARFSGKQAGPSPVVSKKGTAWVKLSKLVGFVAFVTMTPTMKVRLVRDRNELLLTYKSI